MTINKQALREAAENATPGDWCSDDRHGVIADSGLNGNYYIASCSGPEHRDNKRFIAAANPATVLALLDELEAAEKRIAELTWKPANEYADDEDLLFEIDFCDDLSNSIQVAQWLKELRIRRAAGIITKVGE